ncbi:transposase, partial [Rhizobium johnstonii]
MRRATAAASIRRSTWPGMAAFQLLCTIPGIGPINALTILAEAGDLR